MNDAKHQPPYVSHRGFQLVTQETEDVPVLTVENYCKWYTLQLLRPDGTVEPVLYPPGGFHDHVPYPAAVIALATNFGWHLDPQALEMIVGRWTLELLHRDAEELGRPGDFRYPRRQP